MSDGHTASGRATNAAHSAGVGVVRVVRAWRSLPRERRLAAYASIGLFLALFLPWYQRQFFVIVNGIPKPASDSQTGWAAFSFAEAAVLLVAVGVLTLLFQRAEGRAFHLPGGDGWVITAAGFWTCVLIIWRIFDKQGATSHSQSITTSGIEWGIFVALAVAAFLAYSGQRIRAAHQPEPPLPGEQPRAAAPREQPRAGAPREQPRPEAPRPAGRSASLPAGRPEPPRLRSWSAQEEGDPTPEPQPEPVRAPAPPPPAPERPVRAHEAQGERPGWSSFSSAPAVRRERRPQPPPPPDDDQLTIPFNHEEE
jgi:hypothetical protein